MSPDPESFRVCNLHSRVCSVLKDDSQTLSFQTKQKMADTLIFSLVEIYGSQPVANKILHSYAPEEI